MTLGIYSTRHYSLQRTWSLADPRSAVCLSLGTRKAAHPAALRTAQGQKSVTARHRPCSRLLERNDLPLSSKESRTGGFQFLKPTRQKLLSKQQGPTLTGLRNRRWHYLNRFTSFNSFTHSFTLKLARVLSSQGSSIHLPGHHSVLNRHIDVTCYLKISHFYVLACAVVTSRAVNSQTLFLYEPLLKVSLH